MTLAQVFYCIGFLAGIIAVYWKLRLSLLTLQKDINSNKEGNALEIINIKKDLLKVSGDMECHRLEVKSDLERNRHEVKSDLKDFIRDNKDDHGLIFKKLDEIRDKLPK